MALKRIVIYKVRYICDMAKPALSIKTIIIALLCLFTGSLQAQSEADQKHLLTVIRLIGHEILLDAGDSTSQVLPIIKKADTYTIQFESEFQFQPEALFKTIDSVVRQTKIALVYIVEVETCLSKEIIYSYEARPATKAEMIPCATRTPDKACYQISFTILETADTNPSFVNLLLNRYKLLTFIVLLIVIVLTIYKIWLKRKKGQKLQDNPNYINIGQYQFDTINSELIIPGKRVSFSAKESALLLLLHSAANTTVEREIILKEIWGDEGDYIGRTLDVFISKLRKKIETDTNLKIVNIRSVGYKLVIGLEG